MERETVTEICDAIPENIQVLKFTRREGLHLKFPEPQPMKLWRDHELLSVVHLRQHSVPAKFSPPRDVFGGDSLRLEW